MNELLDLLIASSKRQADLQKPDPNSISPIHTWEGRFYIAGFFISAFLLIHMLWW